MFIYSLLIGVIIGYIFKGKLRNIETDSIRLVYLIPIGFVIEAFLVLAIRNGILSRGIVSFIVDLIMYTTLFTFVYANRSNGGILIMGIGFLLNALVIFLNGGAMPVSSTAAEIVGLTEEISSQGLYRAVDISTRLVYLGDIIPIKYPSAYVVSIGDIISAIGIIVFIVSGMKRKRTLKILTVQN
jgi:hypothetical protein